MHTDEKRKQRVNLLLATSRTRTYVHLYEFNNGSLVSGSVLGAELPAREAVWPTCAIIPFSIVYLSVLCGHDIGGRGPVRSPTGCRKTMRVIHKLPPGRPFPTLGVPRE